MPIYEFACPDCRTIFSFLGKLSDRHRKPACPQCGRKALGRVPSVFAISAGGSRSEGPGGESGDGSGDREGAGAGAGDPLDGLPPAQQARMERELGRLMSQAEHLDESNPREMGAFMRRMTEVTGMPRDGAMEEAIRRMEAGEDPERVEEELGDVLGGAGGDDEDGGGGYGGFGRDGGMHSF